MVDKMMRVAGRDGENKAKGFLTTQSGKSLTVQRIGNYVDIQKQINTVGTTSQVLYQERKACVLDSLVLLADRPDLQLRVSIYDKDGVPKPIYLVRFGSFGVNAIHDFQNLRDDSSTSGGYSDYFELVNYDSVNNRYALRNRRPIHAENGLRISLLSPSGDITTAYAITIYEED